MSNDTWIKREEQQPKASDYPIWVCDPSRPLDGDRNNSGIYLRNFGQEIYPGVKYWKPCTVPAPPKPEPTQEQSDSREYQKWQGSYEIRETGNAFQAWMAALAYRDAQNRQDLEACDPWAIFRLRRHRGLRRRCGLDT